MSPETVDEEKLLANAVNQFNALLSFFPRAESKLNTLLGFNLGMLAIMGVNVPKFTDWNAYLSVCYAAAICCIAASLFYIYRSSYPTIIAGKRSLVFFNDIAANSETEFIQKFRGEFACDYTDDMLRQIWYNAEVLRRRFGYLREAHKYLALAILPWLVALAISGSMNHSLHF